MHFAVSDYSSNWIVTPNEREMAAISGNVSQHFANLCSREVLRDYSLMSAERDVGR